MSTDLVQQGNDDVVAALVHGTALPDQEIVDDVAGLIAQRILGAEDVDTVLGMFDSTPIQELLGIALEVLDVRFNASSFTEGPPVYAVIDATRLDDGSRLTATCGGRSVMSALYRIKQLDGLPIRIKVEEGRNSTPAGNKVLILKRA